MRDTITELIPVSRWMAFGILVVVLLAIDLIGHRGTQAPSHTLHWGVFWVAIGLGFAALMGGVFSSEAMQEYLATYLIEWSLSLDNLFMFLVIFQSLQIPTTYHYRTLFWGLVGALVFRGVFLLAGTAALNRWDWVTFVFGAILLYTAYQTYRKNPAEKEESKTVMWLSERLPFFTDRLHQGKFMAHENGKPVATPLLLALAIISVTDVAFAIDSVGAALSITRDRFILYSGTFFAVLGLRTLYFLLAQTTAELKYLHYGLAVVLAFAGLKLMISPWISIPPFVSVGGIVVAIGIAISASWKAEQKLIASRSCRRDKEPNP